jgi:purine-binding chemotaxis protein CheW
MRAETTSNQTDAELRLATFYLGEQLLGVDIRLVQEINRLTDITPVPLAPDFVRGVVNLRGEVVTVLDLRAVLGLEPSVTAGQGRNVVLEYAGEKTGLLVDRVADVVTTTAGEIEPAPANVHGADGRFFQGVVKLEHELLVLLDVQAVLDNQGWGETNESGTPARTLATAG